MYNPIKYTAKLVEKYAILQMYTKTKQLSETCLSGSVVKTLAVK